MGSRCAGSENEQRTFPSPFPPQCWACVEIWAGRSTQVISRVQGLPPGDSHGGSSRGCGVWLSHRPVRCHHCGAFEEEIKLKSTRPSPRSLLCCPRTTRPFAVTQRGQCVRQKRGERWLTRK